MNTEIISATTFQINHLPNTPFKNNYDVGDQIIHPLGQGVITEINANGDCCIKLTKLTKGVYDSSDCCPNCGYLSNDCLCRPSYNA